MDVYVEYQFDQPARRVWSHCGNFRSVAALGNTFSLIEVEGEGVGMLRKLYRTEGGAPDVQRLDMLDDDSMTLGGTLIQPTFLDASEFQFRYTIVPLAKDRCKFAMTWSLTLPAGACEDDYSQVLTGWTQASMQRLDRYMALRDQQRSQLS